MPDWLRRPPPWRGVQESATHEKVVPPTDASPIDPRTILTVEDLPGWLQRIAARRPEQPVGEAGPDPGGEYPTPQQPDPVEAISESVGEPSPRPAVAATAWIPFGMSGSSDDPVPLTMTPASPSVMSQLLPSRTRAVALLAFLLIAVIVIVLVAAIIL